MPTLARSPASTPHARHHRDRRARRPRRGQALCPPVKPWAHRESTVLVEHVLESPTIGRRSTVPLSRPGVRVLDTRPPSSALRFLQGPHATVIRSATARLRHRGSFRLCRQARVRRQLQSSPSEACQLQCPSSAASGQLNSPCARKHKMPRSRAGSARGRRVARPGSVPATCVQRVLPHDYRPVTCEVPTATPSGRPRSHSASRARPARAARASTAATPPPRPSTAPTPPLPDRARPCTRSRRRRGTLRSRRGSGSPPQRSRPPPWRPAARRRSCLP